MKHAKKDEFFDEVKRWSERKHRLLGKYLPPLRGRRYSWHASPTPPRLGAIL
jgi:hypothetical protein